MPYILVRGVEHYYEWIRTPADQHKPVMVFIHGWAGSDRYWESTAHALSDQFDCLLYDMRGFGRSGGQPSLLLQASASVADSQLPSAQPAMIAELTYELEEYAEDLAAFLKALHLERVYLNAHSMGASIATLFLNRQEGQVEKAILTCSGVFEYDEPSFTTFHKFGGYVVKFRPKWLGKIPFVDRMFMARFLHRSIPAAARRNFLEDFLNADYAAALGTIFTSVSKQAAETMPQEFAKLTVPTLLVAGEYDKIIPAAMGRQAAAMNDKIQFILIPNTSHFPMLEDPVTYLQQVRGFLSA